VARWRGTTCATAAKPVVLASRLFAANHVSDAQVARQAYALAEDQRAEVRALLNDWRAWTWVRAQAAESQILR